MVVITKNLDEFQSTHILTLDTRSAGLSDTIRLMIEGNSLLSSIFVKSITGSPSLQVRYFEITSGLEQDEQRYIGDEHPAITAASSVPDQRLLTPFHNKVFCEIDITGTGTMEFGIYVTVVSSFASLLDRALKNHLETVDLNLDQGMPLVLQDPSDGKWYLAKGDEGCLTISGTVSTIPGSGSFVQAQTTTTPGVEQTIFTFAVPALTTRNISNLKVSCRLPTSFNLEAGGVIIASGRTGAGVPNARSTWFPARPVAAGATVSLKLTARSGLPAADVEAYLDSSDVV
jgi:hypothetical protein